MDINELIGERISQARTRRGWNQSELARRLGKPRQHLSLGTVDADARPDVGHLVVDGHAAADLAHVEARLSTARQEQARRPVHVRAVQRPAVRRRGLEPPSARRPADLRARGEDRERRHPGDGEEAAEVPGAGVVGRRIGFHIRLANEVFHGWILRSFTVR